MIALQLAAAAVLVAPATPAPSSEVSVSLRKLRAETYAQSVMQILSPTSSGATSSLHGLDILQTFDQIVVGSTDMRRMSSTYVVLNHHQTRDEMRAVLDKSFEATGQTIEWEQGDGSLAGNPVPADGSKDLDPRWFVLPSRSLLAIVPAADKLAFRRPTDGPVHDLERRIRAASARARKQREVVNFAVADLAQRTTAAVGWRLPDRLELQLWSGSTSSLRSKLSFEDANDSANFCSWWKGDLAKLLDGNLSLKFVLRPIYDDTSVSRKKRTVKLRTKLTEEQLSLILQSAGSFAQREQARIDARREAREAETLREAAPGSKMP